MSEPLELNEVLRGRKILGIEPGQRLAGWFEYQQNPRRQDESNQNQGSD